MRKKVKERPSSFEIVTPVQTLPLTPYSAHKTQYLFIFDSPLRYLEKPVSELPPSRLNRFSSVVWQLSTQKPKTFLLN
jgi:hypothetical protein